MSSSLNFTEIISEYSETIMRNVAPFAALIGAGALAALTFWRIRSGDDQSRRHRLLKRSTSLALIHGGGMALQRLVDYHEARADSNKLNLAECEFMLLFTHERPDFRELARAVARLEMSGKEDKAIEKLVEEIQKAQKKGKSHEEYELEMLLVEMYIYKGDYKKALNHKCLTEENISDARRPLYRAIISLAQEGHQDENEAEMFWKQFCGLRTAFSCRPTVREGMEETGIYKICAGFDEFKKLVDRLKVDIRKAQETRKKPTSSSSSSMI